MGGTLEPEDTPGGGLTMVAIAHRRPRPGPRGPRAGQPGTKPRRGGCRVTEVLVVDDEPSLVRALQINLKARHYQVRTAVTGSDALSVAASHPPDLVILDLGLPDLDGVQVIHGLRGWTDRTDPGAVRPRRQRRQGSSARRRRRRLPDQTVRHRRTAGPDPRAAATRRPDDRRAGRRTGGRDHRPGRPARHRRRSGRPAGGAAHPDRVASDRGPGPPSRQAHLPGATAPRGVGPRLRERPGQPALLHGPTPPKARGRPRPSAAPDHRTRHGLPLPAISHRRRRSCKKAD